MDILQIVQIVTLGVIIAYTWATFRMASAAKETVNEMSKTREQEFAPYVVVYFDVPYGKQLIELVVKNIGKTPAKNVKIEFEPPLRNSEPKINLNEVGFIKNGIPMLPPGCEIRTFVDSTITYFDEKKKLPLKYKVKVSWLDKGKEIDTEWNLDLSLYYNRLFVRKKGLHELVETTERINRSIEKVQNSLSKVEEILSEGLWVKTYTSVGLIEPISPEVWKNKVLFLLNSYKIFWEEIYKKDPYKLVNPFYRNIRNILVSITLELTKIIATCPIEISEEIKKEVNEIIKKMFDLSYFRFFINGGRENFNKLGDEILEEIKKLTKRIKEL